MTNENVGLVAMRLADMHQIHPQQDNSRVCSRCGQRVGLYPSGQKAVRENPGIEIVCMICVVRDRDEADDVRPASSWPETIQEVRDSKDVDEA